MDNDQPHSYVWPADYNWMKPQHHAEVSTVSQVNFPVSSTGNDSKSIKLIASERCDPERR